MMENTIIQKFKDYGVKVSALANDLGVNRSAVYQSIHGDGSRNIRIEIAKKFNEKPSDLWPDNDFETLKLDDALFYHEVKSHE